MTGLILAALVSACALTSSAVATPGAGGLDGAPAFYAMFGDEYGAGGDIAGLHQNLVAVPHYDPVDLSEFDWARGGVNDFSWWVQIEELRFLLPLIASDEPEDRRLARRWFMHWHTAHRMERWPNKAAWWPMTIAYRAMVLVYYLQREFSRARPDATLIQLIWESIDDHQAQLALDANFESDSNHGLLQAFALLETCRASANEDYRALAWSRLMEVARASVSRQGSHLEHSPYYHFVFLRWLDHFVTYLERVPAMQTDALAALTVLRDRMLGASYYYQGHDGDVPPIGDADATAVRPAYRRERPTWGPVLFDAEAGFAVYKGDGVRDRRYVVFANQTRPAFSPAHVHDDVLSVFYAHDGETVLGDQGRYTYARGSERRYFVSPAAHNTVFPETALHSLFPRTTMTLADSSWSDSSLAAVSFAARVRYPAGSVERRVAVTGRSDALVVHDTVRAFGGNAGASGAPDGNGANAFALTWNLGPDVTAVAAVSTDLAGAAVYRLTTRSGRTFRLEINMTSGVGPSEFDTSVVTGAYDPMLGWYAPSFGTKVPSPVVLVKTVPDPAVFITTRITPARSAPPIWLRILERGY